ncbi:hypothetical protein F4777DRAFT_583560 [Nemania sp. FL0916]|nr:hypothetical protein F4777DRAFT_583560 [Nemania sp. FL0916]
MRLFKLQDDGELILTRDLTSDIPPYAILSHTWGSDDEEVTYKDIIEGTGRNKDGYRKIQFCSEQAAVHGLRYFWVDSCCIDKSNSTELSQAINSMFRWYYNAAKCYVYLSDIWTNGDKPTPWRWNFRKSRWFFRGWTLQELVAPSSVEFFSADGRRIGDKKSMVRELSRITGIPTEVLRGNPLSDFSRRERMSWVERRTTKFDEDRAYCLLGIFGVYLPLLYGEGGKNAFRRLEEEIDKQASFERRQLRNNPPLTIDHNPSGPMGLKEPECHVLRSLWFPSMNTRCANLETPAKQTGFWLFEHEVYQDWFLSRNRDKTHGLLWLKGKPGAGKSVLIKEAFRQAVLGQDKSDYLTAAFFFNAKGDELENSPLGLFRSLLYQLLPRDKWDLRHFYRLWRRTNRKDGTKVCTWQETQLRDFFQSRFTHERDKRTLIFIDALDECDAKSVRSQASFWREVTESAYKAGVHLNVCISTRSFPSITVPNCQELVVENYNSNDIITYVNQKFTLSIADKEPEWELLRDKVLRKATGVFLWVVLVVDDILSRWDDGESIQFLLMRLDTVPEELQSLFRMMFASLDSNMRELTIQVFQWAVLAVKPLRLHEWHHILAFIGRPTPSSLCEWRESHNFTHNDAQLERNIRSISRGLIEVVTCKDEVQNESLETISVCAGAGSLNVECGETRIVQVIHESVREFFLGDDGFSTLCPGLTSEPIGYGHCSIMATCLDYINIKELDALVDARYMVEQPEKDGSMEGSPEPSSSRNPHVPAQPAGNVLNYPISTDQGSGLSIDIDRDLRRIYHARKQRKIEPASVFELVKKSFEPSSINMTRWLEGTLPTEQCVVDPVSPNEWACNSPAAPSVTGQSQVLEDYPALLSYATFEFFTHARLAEEKDADPGAIISRLMIKGGWARWKALRENIPRKVELRNYVADLGLSSWVKHIPASPQEDPRQEQTLGPWSSTSNHVPSAPTAPRKRRRSVASFSSASSHIG